MTNHPDIEQLIPWYVNGTLDEHDHSRVNRHLEACDACRDLVRAEVALARSLCVPPAQLDTIDAERGRAALLAGLPRRPRRRRRRVPLAAMMALLVCVAAAAFLFGRQFGEPAYRTLTGTGTVNGPVLQLVLAPQADAADLQALLDLSAGTLLSGPSSGGVYRIALGDRGGSDAAQLARRLQADPTVRWVTVEAP